MKNTFNIKEIEMYTDGSCHTQKRIGAWVAILLWGREKIILRGNEANTTHNRMEILAVIKGIEYVGNNISGDAVIQIVTDSQYVMGLPARGAKLQADNFITKKGKDLQNSDLLKLLFHLFAKHNIYLKKIKSHQKKDETTNYNIMADKLSRANVRKLIMEK
ncbi:MAG: RNase H family protein [Ferruginibacter sp.]